MRYKPGATASTSHTVLSSPPTLLLKAQHRCFPSSVLFCCQFLCLACTVTNCTLLGVAFSVSNKMYFTNYKLKHRNRSLDMNRKIVLAGARAERRKRFIATTHIQLETEQLLKINFKMQLCGSSKRNVKEITLI